MTLGPLAYDQRLADIAQNHSQDMASNDYFAHNNLSGQTPTDRGDTVGYTCRKDYGSYYTVGIAENIVQTWLFSSYTTTSRNYMTLDQIAAQAVELWMDSPGHRENILGSEYDREGIGIAVSEQEKVYATQNFC
ncbi:MAG: CAP domain-containing protein [SAR202 cluster bacterium]|nr:CAP domain-containing protein [SAR202 cluster bacterium]